MEPRRREDSPAEASSSTGHSERKRQRTRRISPPTSYDPSSSAGPSRRRRSSSSLSRSRRSRVSEDEGPAVASPGGPAFQGENFVQQVHGAWIYELRVIQQPQRARACGFGDKDRRPLSPPPIVQLIVRDISTGQIVDPDLIDIAYLVLFVELSSSDTRTPRNVVMHPSSQGLRDPSPQYPPFAPQSNLPGPSLPSSRPYSGERRPLSGYGIQTMPGESSPYIASPGPSPHTRLSGGSQPEAQLSNPLPIPSPPSAYGYGITPSRPPIPRAHSYTNRPLPPDHHEYSRPTSSPHAQLHPPPFRGTSTSTISPSRSSLTLPSLSTVTSAAPGRAVSLTLPALQRTDFGGPGVYEDQQRRRPPSSHSYQQTDGSQSSRPSWSTDISRHTDYSFGRQSTASASTWHTSSMSSSAAAGPSNYGDRPLSGQSSKPSNPVPRTTYGHLQDEPMRFPSPSRPPSSQAPIHPPQPELVPVHSYSTEGNRFSRVLVGSLFTTCQKLKGLDGRTGIFFFHHDLGVRTEGIFTLHFKLAGLGAFMTGASIPANTQHIFSEIWSDPFQVYSAKRFPGVIGTTDITEHFARQGVRLPTRRRNPAATRTAGENTSQAGLETEGDPED